MISFKQFVLESWASKTPPSTNIVPDPDWKWTPDAPNATIGQPGTGPDSKIIGDMYPEVAKGWYEALDYEQRPMVILELGRGKLAFYQSSQGTSGKNKGTWYPFFGIGKGGYVIKGSLDLMEAGYNQPQVKQMMNALNATYPPWESGKLDVSLFKPPNGLGGKLISREAYGKPEFRNIRHPESAYITPEEKQNLVNHIQDILTRLGFSVTPDDIVNKAAESGPDS